MEILSNGLNNIDLILIIFCCFLGSAITTSVGMGGGIVVIGTMALFLPINAVIPIHAITQCGAGIMRAYIFRKTFLKKFFFIFILGTILGYYLSLDFIMALTETKLKLILGIGIIVLAFLPKFTINSLPNKFIFSLGALTGFLTMFLGIMGPILGTVLNSFLKDRYLIVGTIAWCISFQNLGKAIILGSMGFDFLPWIYLIILLIFFSYLGTVVGKKFLDKSNNQLFQKILKIVILILGFKLIIEAIIVN